MATADVLSEIRWSFSGASTVSRMPMQPLPERPRSSDAVPRSTRRRRALLHRHRRQQPQERGRCLRRWHPAHDFVAANAAAFRALGPLLDLAPDDFVEISRDPRHRCAVEWLWRRCAASGDLYRRTWSGCYCAGCEAFLDENVERCHEHDGVPEHITEDNWFFLLSRYRDPIRNAIAPNRLRIVSESARVERTLIGRRVARNAHERALACRGQFLA